MQVTTEGLKRILSGPKDDCTERRHQARVLAEALVISLQINGRDRSLIAWLVERDDLQTTNNNLDAITQWVFKQLSAPNREEPEIKMLKTRLLDVLDGITGDGGC